MDDAEIDEIVENDYDVEKDREEYENKTGDYDSPFTDQGVLKKKPEFK